MKFLDEPELIYLHTVKWFQIFLSNTNNSVWYHLFAHSEVVSSIVQTNSFSSAQLNWFQVLLFNTNNSIQHKSFAHNQMISSIAMYYQ